MKLNEAQELAQMWREKFAPYFDILKIAGSIRREKPEVKDIELVGIPYPGTNLFFEETYDTAPIYLAIDKMKDGHNLITTKNGRHYVQLYSISHPIKVDLFIIIPPRQFGYHYALRTGPAEFSKALVTRKQKGGLMPSNLRASNGVITNRGKAVPIPTEADLFKLYGLDYIEPNKR